MRTSSRVALVAAVVLGLWFLWSKAPAPELAVRTPAQQQREADRNRAIDDERERPAPTPARAPTPTPPVIDEIVVEKDAVCAGEDNLVTVRAHATDGAPSLLRARIGPSEGWSVPLRSAPAADGWSREQRAFVVGGDGEVAEAVLPRWQVKDCEAPFVAVIDARSVPNATDRYRFSVRVTPYGEQRAFDLATVRWSFGDGTPELRVDGADVVEHDYIDRVQAAALSSFVVRAVARSEAGDEVIGRLALTLDNPGFEARRRGQVLVQRALDPLYPVLGDDGVVRQGVRLFHGEADAVTITELRRTAERDDGREVAPDVIAAASIVPGGVVPPGSGVSFVVELDTRADEHVTAINYELVGHAADGAPVQGGFAVMRPPTRRDFVPIEDPAVAARIQRALDILGKPTATAEEIAALERAGRL